MSRRGCGRCVRTQGAHRAPRSVAGQPVHAPTEPPTCVAGLAAPAHHPMRSEPTARRISRTTERSMTRSTRTQDRPASRRVNDHGRVSGTHRVAHPGRATESGRRFTSQPGQRPPGSYRDLISSYDTISGRHGRPRGPLRTAVQGPLIKSMRWPLRPGGLPVISSHTRCLQKREPW